MRSRLQPIMEQEGESTATKSLNGHCKEVRTTHRALCYVMYVSREAFQTKQPQTSCYLFPALFVIKGSNLYLQHYHVGPLDDFMPAA